jgi:hypothetical protein
MTKLRRMKTDGKEYVQDKFHATSVNYAMQLYLFMVYLTMLSVAQIV